MRHGGRAVIRSTLPSFEAHLTASRCQQICVCCKDDVWAKSRICGGRLRAGGASNSGGAVLRKFFTDEELSQLTDRIDISRSLRV